MIVYLIFYKYQKFDMFMHVYIILREKELVFSWIAAHLPSLAPVKEITPIYYKYIFGEKAKKQNKIVFCLPFYHCELNPVELAWTVVKNHVKQNSTTIKLNDVRQLLIDGVQQVTPEILANFVRFIKRKRTKCGILITSPMKF